MGVDGYLGHRFAQPQAVLSVPVGDARVGRTKGQTICGGPRWGRAGWEGLRGLGGLMARPFVVPLGTHGLGGLMARPFVVVPVGDARDGRGCAGWED
jgi:hypothetical protein